MLFRHLFVIHLHCSNIQGKSKSEKRDFRARQRAKHIGGQEDAFEDWDDGPMEPVGLAKVKPAVKNNRTRQDWENEGIPIEICQFSVPRFLYGSYYMV